MTDRDPELRIRLSKRTDGSVTLHCTRRDGTGTWQRQTVRSAGFFAFHDLRHFAVETILGIRQGFFGLIADGWNIPDTDGKGARGSLPTEALFAEQLVGLMDRERIGGAAPLTATEVRTHLSELPEPVTGDAMDSLTDEQLNAIRVLADELHATWAVTEAAMELAFDRRRFAP